MVEFFLGLNHQLNHAENFLKKIMQKTWSSIWYNQLVAEETKKKHNKEVNPKKQGG